jgi:hypothetical protein
MAGCIPVVFYVETLHTLYPHFINVSTALAMSVYFPHEKLNNALYSPSNCSLIKWLVEIQHSDEVLLKRQVIGNVVKKLQYSLPVEPRRPPGSPDAFDVILDVMTRRPP